MASKRAVVAALVIALVVVVGIAGAYLMMPKSELGTVSMYVKDLPDGWTHVNVTFSEVRIHEADVVNESGWHTLPIQQQTVDLAVLTNVSALLASGNVTPGKYTQIRLVVVSVTGTMEDGTVVNFTVPSGELKTTHPFNVTAGHEEALTLDFDLSQCIVHNGSGWIFRPVLGSISS